jgi:nickel-type superoxide dismutase maturation protease
MLPLLKPGEEVLVDPKAYQDTDPQPGDIVVARHPLQPDIRMIKRVKARLEDGCYRLEGDNSLESTDSRSFGPVPREHILGRVTSRFG